MQMTTLERPVAVVAAAAAAAALASSGAVVAVEQLPLFACKTRVVHVKCHSHASNLVHAWRVRHTFLVVGRPSVCCGLENEPSCGGCILCQKKKKGSQRVRWFGVSNFIPVAHPFLLFVCYNNQQFNAMLPVLPFFAAALASSSVKSG